MFWYVPNCSDMFWYFSILLFLFVSLSHTVSSFSLLEWNGMSSDVVAVFRYNLFHCI